MKKPLSKNSIFHINWGDGDNSYIIAPDKKTAISRMADGKGMINYVVKLKHLYNLVLRQMIEWGDGDCPHDPPNPRAKLMMFRKPIQRHECLECWQELSMEVIND